MIEPETCLVIPCYNEEGNFRGLIMAIRTVIESLHLSYEVVVTDDYSRDKSWEVHNELDSGDARIRVHRFTSFYDLFAVRSMKKQMFWYELASTFN